MKGRMRERAGGGARLAGEEMAGTPDLAPQSAMQRPPDLPAKTPLSQPDQDSQPMWRDLTTIKMRGAWRRDKGAPGNRGGGAARRSNGASVAETACPEFARTG